MSVTPDSRPALLGGAPLRLDSYPAWPQWDDGERAALAGVLESGAWWTGDGSRAQAFADRFAAFQDCEFGLPMTNGTHTLQAALVACGVGEGDEVIVPALTFVATASSVLALGATPVMVDVDPGTLCIDVDAAEAAIGDRTRAMIAVHLAGAVADLDRLVPLCEARGLHLIEDCAHAHGSRWRGRRVGSYGSFGSFSFQQSKLMTAGEGGTLVCRDGDLAAAARSYLDGGREPGRWFYHHASSGSNMRMTEWQGAVLGAQLDRFPEQHRRRNELRPLLDEAIASVPGLTPQTRDPRADEIGTYCYVFHYDADAFAGLPLRRFEQALAAEGIPLSVSYPAMHRLVVFDEQRFAPQRASAPTIDYRALSFPVAERAAGAAVWLQHRILLADERGVDDVAKACEKLKRCAAELA